MARALAARGERPPAAWVSWIADGFFAQRYRRVFWLPALPAPRSAGARAAPPLRPVRLRIELAPGLPPGLALAVYQMEILR